MRYKGFYTALVTPFNSVNTIDEKALRHLIQRQLEAGVDGILFFGSTGEGHTLSLQEKKYAMEIAHEEIKQRCLLIMAIGSNHTDQAIEHLNSAEKFGADIVLVDVPYHNKPTQEGLYRHFKCLSQKTHLPLLIYNNPGRSAVNLLPETLARLAKYPLIVGVKESCGSITQISDVLELTRAVRPDFTVLSGDDALSLPLIALGGDGVISVVGNLLPKLLKELIDACLSGDFECARHIHFNLMPLFRAAFIETNPIPIKTAMAMSGLVEGRFRLPLCELSEKNVPILKESLCYLSNPLPFIQEKILKNG